MVTNTVHSEANNKTIAKTTQISIQFIHSISPKKKPIVNQEDEEQNAREREHAGLDPKHIIQFHSHYDLNGHRTRGIHYLRLL